MPTKSVIRYTIRGVPREVDRELRRRAKESKASLNRIVIEELVHATGVSLKKKYRSIESLVGVWKEDPEFDQIMAEHRKIDKELWR
jgi:hypothetical protein